MKLFCQASRLRNLFDYLSVSLNFAFTFGFPCSNILILLPTFFVMNKSVIVKQHFFSLLIEGCEGIKYPSTPYVV